MTQKLFAYTFFSSVTIAAIGLIVGVSGLHVRHVGVVTFGAMLYLGGALVALGVLVKAAHQGDH